MSCTTSGWYWYCDVHDTHGNADTQDEAEAISEAHQEYHDLMDDDFDGCDLTVTQVKN
jgi:hypothetical protein